jgi:hypothetical protein
MNSGYIPAPPLLLPTLPKSWFSRNWKWFIPTLILGLVLLLALFVGGLLTFVFGLLKSSEPYQHAVAVASSNLDVVRELGDRSRRAGIFPATSMYRETPATPTSQSR